MPEVILRRLLHLLKDDRRDLRGCVPLALYLNRCDLVGTGHDLVGHAGNFTLDFIHLTSHKPLDGKDGVRGVRDRLTFGDLPYQPFAILGEPNHRWGGAPALGVWDDDRVATLHDRHYGICRP